jgi:hypothetical protein
VYLTLATALHAIKEITYSSVQLMFIGAFLVWLYVGLVLPKTNATGASQGTGSTPIILNAF